MLIYAIYSIVWLSDLSVILCSGLNCDFSTQFVMYILSIPTNKLAVC